MGANQSFHSQREFSESCRNGNLIDVIKIWNCAKENNHYIDIHFNNEEAFYFSCVYGHLQLARWLWFSSIEIGSPINIYVKKGYIFSYSCQNGKIEIVKWLMELSIKNNSPINFSLNNHEAFRMSCVCEQYNIAEWLCSINPEYYLEKYQDGSLQPKIVTFFDNLIKNKENPEKIEKLIQKFGRLENNKVCLICHEENNFVISLKCYENINDHCFCIDCFCDWYKGKKLICIVCTKEFLIK